MSRVAPPTGTMAAKKPQSHRAPVIARLVFSQKVSAHRRRLRARARRADHIVLAPPSATVVNAMPIRPRKFGGAVLLLVLVIVWTLVAMALAQALGIHNSAID